MNHEDAIVTKVRAAVAGQVAFDSLEASVGHPAVARKIFFGVIPLP